MYAKTVVRQKNSKSFRATRSHPSTMSLLEPELEVVPEVTLMWPLATLTSFQMPNDTAARRMKRMMMMMAITSFFFMATVVGGGGGSGG